MALSAGNHPHIAAIYGVEHKVWSESRLANIGPNANYGIVPDGKRIVAAK